jgi:hypothetical protein
MIAKQYVINLAGLAHRVEVQLLNPFQGIGIKPSKALATRRRTSDGVRSLQASAIDDVVFKNRPHFAFTCGRGGCGLLLCTAAGFGSLSGSLEWERSNGENQTGYRD